jgi:hypothetical protein
MPAISLDNLSKFKTKLLSKLETMFIKTTSKGAAGGVATLDNSGKVPSSQLPSYVDDIIEGVTVSDFPETGEAGKIYVATSTNIAYRWTNSGYVGVQSSLVLGVGETNAFRGDYGQTAYAHATDPDKATATAEGFYKISTSGHGHVKSLTSVTAQDITSLGIPAQDTTYDLVTTAANGLMSSADKTKLNGLANATVYYAECSSAATATEKIAVCLMSLLGASPAGALLFVKFDNTNTAAVSDLELTVSFNGTATTAMPIKCQQKDGLSTLSTPGFLIGGHTYLFECDGQNWILMNAGNAYGEATSDEPGLMTAEDKARLQSPVFEKLYYGTCMTEMEVKDKKVLCPDLRLENLTAGVIVFVYFQNGNSAAEDTLTMEVGSTGVKPLKCLLRGQISKLPFVDYLLGYQTYMFQYDGTNWVLMNTDTNDDASFAIDESTGELMVTVYQ